MPLHKKIWPRVFSTSFALDFLNLFYAPLSNLFWTTDKFFTVFAANAGCGEEEVVMEMNPQEKEFLEMSHEFTGDCSETDVLQVTLHS